MEHTTESETDKGNEPDKSELNEDEGGGEARRQADVRAARAAERGAWIRGRAAPEWDGRAEAASQRCWGRNCGSKNAT